MEKRLSPFFFQVVALLDNGRLCIIQVTCAPRNFTFGLTATLHSRLFFGLSAFRGQSARLFFESQQGLPRLAHPAGHVGRFAGYIASKSSPPPGGGPPPAPSLGFDERGEPVLYSIKARELLFSLLSLQVKFTQSRIDSGARFLKRPCPAQNLDLKLVIANGWCGYLTARTSFVPVNTHE
jgi:hypothetical protein